MVFMALTMALRYFISIPVYVSADYLSLFPWYCQPIVVGIETLGALTNQFSILEICLLTSSVAGICVFSKMDGVDSGFNLWNYILRSMSAGGIVTAIFANRISLSAIVLIMVWILPAMIDFLRNDHLLRNGFFVPIIVLLFSLLILLIRWRLGHTFPVNNTNSLPPKELKRNNRLTKQSVHESK
jgi:hypothetical protein